MSTTTDAAVIAGASGTGDATVRWSIDPTEHQILVRVDRGGIHTGQRELRYQLEHKDNHPLAQADDLLDVLADLEAQGLLEAELCFRLTATGRERLAAESQEPARAFAVMEDDSVLCADCVQEVCRERDAGRAEAIVHAWIDPGPGVCCRWCGESAPLEDERRAAS
jgi:hypothetical protein